jgi:hypothetical protein
LKFQSFAFFEFQLVASEGCTIVVPLFSPTKLSKI